MKLCNSLRWQQVVRLGSIQYAASEPDVPTWVCSKFQEVSVKLEQAIIRWIITIDAKQFLSVVSALELDQIFSSAKRQAPIITSSQSDTAVLSYVDV